MTILPNWVDLIVITLVILGCYNGFGRGLLAELLNLIGAISVTAFTMNYAGFAARWVHAFWSAQPILVSALVFWGIFAILMVLKRLVVRTVATAIKWERLHWIVQGLGLLLGGMRGLWWGGLVLVALASSGITYLQQSVAERSVVGPRLLVVAQTSLQRVADAFPGAAYRGEVLVPPLRQPVAAAK